MATGGAPQIPTPPGSKQVLIAAIITAAAGAVGVGISAGTAQILAGVAILAACIFGPAMTALLHRHWTEAAVRAREAAVQLVSAEADKLAQQNIAAQLPPGTVFPSSSPASSPAVEKTP